MQRYEDRSTMQDPGVCFICEQTPTDGVGYVDTDSNFAPGFPSSLSGRKYVCDGCVKNIAEAAGLFASGAIAEAQRTADEATARYNAVLEHVEKAQKAFDVKELVDAGDRSSYVVTAKVDDQEIEVPVEVKPKTATKKADVPA